MKKPTLETMTLREKIAQTCLVRQSDLLMYPETNYGTLRYPYIHYNFMDECPIFVNGYNATPDTQEAFVAAIYGEIPFLGKSPIDLNMD